MAGYLSSILTSTTSRYNNLRKNLLSDETDGDTENDSHISRVLRAYYNEKGRSFPAWLPPDSIAMQQQLSQYGQQYSHKPQPAPTQPRGRSALSDLWDSPATQQPQQSAPQSLRGSTMRTATSTGREASYNSTTGPQRLPPSGARPLPSQREGSYQNAPPLRSDRGSSSTSGPAGGGTVQDKFKAKLWGAPRP